MKLRKETNSYTGLLSRGRPREGRPEPWRPRPLLPSRTRAVGQGLTALANSRESGPPGPAPSGRPRPRPLLLSRARAVRLGRIPLAADRESNPPGPGPDFSLELQLQRDGQARPSPQAATIPLTVQLGSSTAAAVAEPSADRVTPLAGPAFGEEFIR